MIWLHVIIWTALLAAVILYAVKRKWYPLMYLLSIAMYVFTIVFSIDAFSISKDGILLLLAFSTVLMISVGYYLSRKQ